jgi:hypothetical protein
VQPHLAALHQSLSRCAALRRPDVCLEVGCAGGVTTAMIGKACREAVGIDTSDKPVCLDMQAQLTNANTVFFPINGSEIRQVMQLGRQFDVVFIDISGDRPLRTLLPMIESYERALKPRVIVVKNFRLKRLLLHARIFEKPTHAVAGGGGGAVAGGGAGAVAGADAGTGVGGIAGGREGGAARPLLQLMGASAVGFVLGGLAVAVWGGSARRSRS